MITEQDPESSTKQHKTDKDSQYKQLQRRLKLGTAFLTMLTMIVALFKCEKSPINVNKSQTNFNYNLQKESTVDTMRVEHSVISPEKKLVVIHEYHTAPNSAIQDRSQKNRIQKAIDEVPEEGYVSTGAEKCDVAIVVTDESNQIASSILFEVAALYRQKGLKVSSGLFTEKFIHSGLFSKLKGGSSAIASKLSLADFAKYVVVGKYRFKLRDNPGGLVKYVGAGTLDVSIISCESKSLIDGFVLSAQNGFDDEQNAERGTIEKLVKEYRVNHLNQNL